MKRTPFDKFVSFFSPMAAHKRMVARHNMALLERAYDAGTTFRTDDWTSATKGSANAEISKAQGPARERARDAIRNNPYAGQALRTIVSNTVGTGILANIKGKDEKATLKWRAAWNEWSNTTKCDLDGRHDLAGLQALVLRATVESGEVLIKKVYTKDTISLQVLESDFIDNSKDDPKKSLHQGIQLAPDGTRKGYWLYTSHPGDGDAVSKFVKAEDVMHVYRVDRPAQLRGITWFHAVIKPLEDLRDYDNATLIKQKVSACTVHYIKAEASDMALTPEQLTQKRQLDSSMEPGSVRYLNPGEDVVAAGAPGTDGYSEFTRQHLRKASSGVGITYESMSGDYSQSNYSSSRLAKQEMQGNIESWRWQMLIPQFCDKAFEVFKEWASTYYGLNPALVTVEWVPPAFKMIDPSKEVSAIVKAVRAGITTLPKAIREQGYDPDDVFAEAAATNATMDKLGLAFDTDPRKLSTIGFAQAGDSYDKLTGTTSPTSEDTDDNE